MSYVVGLTCVNCGRTYSRLEHFTCERCGPDDGILDVDYDYDRIASRLDPRALARRAPDMWRYRELLPVDFEQPPIAAPIGMTPLLEAPRLAQALGLARLRLKDDTRNPSASFKDRASAVGVAHALAGGADELACASTGNAATSLAFCCAAAGVRANIFVPRQVPEGKLAQLLAYGARVFKVQGSYDDAYRLSAAACERWGWYNRNCAVNPYLVEGKKTAGLEIAEQARFDPPDWVVCSVGDGCSIAGVYKGLIEMRRIGLIAWSTRMLGVQAEGANPIARAFGQDPPPARCRLDEAPGTYADSINVPVPRNWRKALRAVRDSGGAFVSVSDEQIAEAVRLLGRCAAVFAEPAAAASIAGVAQALAQGVIAPGDSVIAVVTGSGLKDVAGALRAVGRPFDVEPELDAVAAVVDGDRGGVSYFRG